MFGFFLMSTIGVLPILLPIAFLLALAARAILFRNAILSLRWGNHLTYHAMRRYSKIYLERAGWDVTLRKGVDFCFSLKKARQFAAVKCFASDVGISVSEMAYLGRLKEREPWINVVVCITFDPPREDYIAAARAQGIWLLHYKDLPGIGIVFE